MSQDSYDQWLLSEANWESRVGEGWVPKRVLGEGSYAIVGLWSYEGPDRHLHNPNNLAVKQALGIPGLDSEGGFLHLFADSGSKHIVKLYRHMSVETGGGTMDKDPLDKVVHRIYLEYCPNGDLSRYMGTQIPELALWGIFHCLALAIWVMHKGNEERSEDDLAEAFTRWHKLEICHFDIKPENVFIGDFTTDEEHRSTTPIKIGDFGLAAFAPKDQPIEHVRKRATRGTCEYFTPEQLYFPLKELRVEEDYRWKYKRPWQPEIGEPTQVRPVRYGTLSNIWQAGLIMLCLVNRMRDVRWDQLGCYQSAYLPGRGPTIGTDETQMEEETEGISLYSKSLRTLIAECLLISPSSRIRPLDLATRTEYGLIASRLAAQQEQEY